MPFHAVHDYHMANTATQSDLTDVRTEIAGIRAEIKSFGVKLMEWTAVMAVLIVAVLKSF